MALNILNDTQIRKAKPKDKEYKLNDGGGLSILIKPNGSKTWVLNYINPQNGKKTNAGLGAYPNVTLVMARDKRAKHKQFIAQGINPTKHFKEQNKTQIIQNETTFEKVFNEWLAIEARKIAPKTLQTKKNRILNHFDISFIQKPIKDIKKGEVVSNIENIAKNTPQTAQIIYQILNQVFHYAISKDHIEHNIISDIYTKALIPNNKVEHYGKLTKENDLHEFINKIYDYPKFVSMKNILKFALHVPLRITPLVTLKWKYVDFDAKTITIPRELQKVKRKDLGNFVLPLSDEVVSILKEQYHHFKGYEFVFVNTTYKGHIHKDSPTKMIEKFGFKDADTGRVITAHSFRGIFKTIALNNYRSHGVSESAIKKALDHLHGNKVDMSYGEKADFMDELRVLFSWYSDYILKLK